MRWCSNFSLRKWLISLCIPLIQHSEIDALVFKLLFAETAHFPLHPPDSSLRIDALVFKL